MRGRVVLGLALALIAAAAAAAAGDPGNGQQKQQIDARIDQLRSEIAQANAHEGVLTSQLSDVTAQLRAAQAEVDGQQARLSALERALAGAQVRLAAQPWRRGRRPSSSASRSAWSESPRRASSSACVELYLHGKPDTLSVLLASTSFSQLLDDVDYARRVARNDRK